jgi:serine/threonine protein kinase
MVAKVGDFGLSKMISIEGASHVTTMAKGTAGYIDPEYVKNLTLNLL